MTSHLILFSSEVTSQPECSDNVELVAQHGPGVLQMLVLTVHSQLRGCLQLCGGQIQIKNLDQEAAS